MKIAICGRDKESRTDMIKSFISQWPMYATPSETIWNTERAWPEKCPEALTDLKEKLNDVERYLFNRILLLEEQYEKFKEEGYLIFDGSSLDILVNAAVLCEDGYISEEFMEKVIYHNKKMLHDIDVIYWLPDETIDEKSNDDDKAIEMAYANLYDSYQVEFDKSPFFDHKNCPSIMIADPKNPLAEVKMLLDSNGNLDTTAQGGSDGGLVDTEKLKKILKGNPTLLNAAMESLKQTNTIGSSPFSGSITL